MKAYQVHYEPGTFDNVAGAEKLSITIDKHIGDGKLELIAVVPIVKGGTSTGVQLVFKGDE